MSARPQLPDGLVAVVKRDCETCVMVAPVLADLAGRDTDLVVFTQDDPTFPAEAPWVRADSDLAVSFHHDIETVPTLIRVSDGVEQDRTVGWQRDAWRSFTADSGLGADLPEFRPGCGSLSVDPDRVDALRALHGVSRLRSRRVELAELEDEIEAMYDRGWSDGLPLVPPTEARVEAMLDATSRPADDIVAVVSPDLIECSVEKVAVNAVMAGCRPEYLPVVLAALEAVCTDEFNLHGVMATTMGMTPVLIVNGPIRRRLDMNSGINALGHGNRANATIGRALQLIVRNVGGSRPGEVERATLGHPGRLGFCFAEDEEGSPWESLAVERGFGSDQSTVTAYCGEGPRLIVDQLSRRPESLIRMLAAAMAATSSPRSAGGFDAVLVLSPEHGARFRDAGWSKARFLAELTEALQIDAATIVRGHDGIDEGMPAQYAGQTLPKFRPGGLMVVHAGGGAGLFSAVIGGWLSGPTGSQPVTKEIVS